MSVGGGGKDKREKIMDECSGVSGPDVDGLVFAGKERVKLGRGAVCCGGC